MFDSTLFPERVIAGVVEQYVRRYAVSVRAVGRQLAVRVTQRDSDRSHVRNRLPEIVGISVGVGGHTRFVLIDDPAAQTGFENRGFGNVDIRVDPEIITFVVRVRIVILFERVLEKSALFVVGAGNIIAGCRASAADIERSFERRGALFQQGVVPVHIGVEVGIEIVFDDFQIAGVVNGVLIPRRAGFVGQRSIGFRIDEFTFDGGRGDAVFGFEIDVHLSCLSAFGRDQYDTVGAALTVDRRCGGVFQNGKRFDILDVDFVEIAFDAVYQHQCRCVGAERRDTADPEFRSVLARFARTLYGDDTRNVSRQRVGDVGGRDFQILHFDRCDRSDHRCFLLEAGADDHDFLHCVGIFYQFDVDTGLACDWNILRRISQVAERECFVGSGSDFVFTVDVGIGSQTGLVFHDDVYAHHRLSLQVEDRAGDRILFALSKCGGRISPPPAK